MKVSTKGQVTIPQEIREEVNIQPGDEVDFIVKEGLIQIVPRPGATSRGRRLVERLRGTATVRLSTDEIMALTRGEA